MQHAWSVASIPVWRVLELIDDGFEQENEQEMGQDIRSGGFWMCSWRPLKPDEALETFESEFDAPPQAIEIEDVIG